MIVVTFFIVQWYISLFFQTFFLHRYAAHAMFTMSKGWERFFFFMTFLFQGSNYLSPYGYGVMHRMHHAFADTERDPHSPKYSSNIFAMMWRTYKIFTQITYHQIEVEPRFTRGVPRWDAFDRFAGHGLTRLAWSALYIGFYYMYADAWWQWLLLPITLTMAPVHGGIINWFAHVVGYRTFEMSNTATNFLPFDFLMMGESYHNNHHHFDKSPNFGYRWHEFDPTYQVIKALNAIGVIHIVPQKASVKQAILEEEEVGV